MTADGTAAAASEPLFCCTLGHESLPAVSIGVFDDGEDADPDVPYCGDCARALISAGEYRVTRVLDALAFGTATCPTCVGTGRVTFRHPSDPSSRGVDQLRNVLAAVVHDAGDAAQGRTSGSGEEQQVMELRDLAARLLTLLDSRPRCP